MKVNGYSAIAGARPLDRTRGTSRTSSATPASDSRGIDDSPAVEVLDLFGVPEAELTPKVKSAILNLMAEVDSLRRELQVANRRITDLEELADKDPLVPVSNRRAFVREMSRMMSYTERYNVPSSLIFFDMNGLKQINDTLGHAAGDKALAAVARVLRDHTRETDVVGRIGGDEFGVILAQADETAAHLKADELADAIRHTEVQHGDRLIPLEVAHGVFSFHQGGDASSALAEADRRMYRRKQEMKAAAGDTG
ncbi:MAG: GGDEF domain-containing protein [Pseudomonadota bacterium]|nr:GGDEF domain-containing protein [Pseudomonadota bacterium]